MDIKEKIVFEKKWQEYDKWYEDHEAVYKSELHAVKELIPKGTGLEIGVGTGRFAAPCHVEFGIDPSINMLRLAKKRNVKVVQGVGEKLPFKNDSFHFILTVVTLCFADNVFSVLKESIRTLKTGGTLIVGMIDKNSPLGKKYQKSRKKSEFYKHAGFLSSGEILDLFKKTGFQFIDSRQTLFSSLHEISQFQTPKKGYDRGGFVVLKAQKI
ncbi:MAG: class I SAM-dependent methyltransferase [Candidatus Aminicenantes bacterium]